MGALVAMRAIAVEAVTIAMLHGQVECMSQQVQQLAKTFLLLAQPRRGARLGPHLSVGSPRAPHNRCLRPLERHMASRTRDRSIDGTILYWG